MPANADLTVNGRSIMTSSALAHALVLVDERAGTGVSSRSPSVELLERASCDDCDHWPTTALAAGGCVRPVQLRVTVRDVDTATGEILHGLDTEDLRDKAIYVPCGDRRASVWPPCAERYRADVYQLIRAGLIGGMGMPESLAAHPCVFATFTAPSSGPVHIRVISSRGPMPDADRAARRPSAPSRSTAHGPYLDGRCRCPGPRAQEDCRARLTGHDPALSAP